MLQAPTPHPQVETVKALQPPRGIIRKCYFPWTRHNLPKGKVKGPRACQPRTVPLRFSGGLTERLTDRQRRKSQFLPGGSWPLPWDTHLCVFSSSLFWTGLFSAVFLFLCGHCIRAVKEFLFFVLGGDGEGHHCLSCHTTRTYSWSRLLITQVFELNQSIRDVRLVSLGEAQACVWRLPTNTWRPKARTVADTVRPYPVLGRPAL